MGRMYVVLLQGGYEVEVTVLYGELKLKMKKPLLIRKSKRYFKYFYRHKYYIKLEYVRMGPMNLEDIEECYYIALSCHV